MFYTAQSLDRADHLRKDDSLILSLLDAEEALFVPFWRGQLLISMKSADKPASMFMNRAQLPLQPGYDRNAEVTPIFLGTQGPQAYFAVDLSALEEHEFELPGGSAWQDLRKVGPFLPAAEGSVLAYARAMLHWQQHSRFCTFCGYENRNRHAGHARVCSNESCGKQSFPRTDPAVIMLVVDQPQQSAQQRCLLGRSPAWPEGVYSTLAGFVEPGETLEQAVSREVFEEAGIRTHSVSYVASQPWPFPQSIMLGFEAIAEYTEITLDQNELADAQWFTRDELEKFGNWGDQNYAQQLPRPDSIARFLIERWRKNDH